MVVIMDSDSPNGFIMITPKAQIIYVPQSALLYVWLMALYLDKTCFVLFFISRKERGAAFCEPVMMQLYFCVLVDLIWST